MRHTNVKVRVTDHWLDAAEFAAFLSSAPQATNFQQQQPMNSVVQSVNKNVACVAEQKTKADDSQKQLALVAEVAYESPQNHVSQSRLPLMYVRGGKEGGYIEEKDYVACVNVSQNPTNPAVDGPLPFLDAGGCLIIPFASPRRYHWWAGGQDLVATLDELRAPAAVVRRYTSTKEFEAWLMQGVM